MEIVYWKNVRKIGQINEEHRKMQKDKAVLTYMKLKSQQKWTESTNPNTVGSEKTAERGKFHRE